MTKKCSKCGIIKEVSEFRKSPSEKDGLMYTCKICTREYYKQYQQSEKNKEYHKKWEMENKDRRKELHKLYEIANKDKRKAQKRAMYLANKNQILEKSRIYKLEHPEQRKVSRKIYYLANKEKAIVQNRKRRALKLGVCHKSYESNSIFERDGWVCQICGQKINKRLEYPHPRSKSIDHIIPLSKGGADAPINIQAAHLRCNLSKQARFGGQLRLIG